MPGSLIVFTLVGLISFGAWPGHADDTKSSKNALLHELMTIMGSDFQETSPQFAVYERNLSEEDIRAALTFYRSSAGQRLIAGTREMLALSIPGLAEVMQRSLQRRTMADLRTFATAVEIWAVDHDDLFPRASDLDSLEKLISTTFLKQLPRLDAWSREYIYVTDGKVYRIVSAGPDGKLSPHASTLGRPDGDFGDDIIYDTGQFVQPRGGELEPLTRENRQ